MPQTDPYAPQEQDRQALYALASDDKFTKLAPDDKAKQLEKLPYFQRIPQKSRDATAKYFASHLNDIVPQKTGGGAEATTPQQETPQPEDLFSKIGRSRIGRVATTPLSEQILGPGNNVRNALKALEPPPARPNVYTRSVDAAGDEAAQLLDDLQSPLGLATLSLGPKITRLAKAADDPALRRALINAAKAAEKIVRYGFTEEQYKGLTEALRDAVKDPTAENISRLASRAVIMVGTNPWRKYPTKTKAAKAEAPPKTGEVAESKSAPPAEKNVAKYAKSAEKAGVSAEQYAEAQDLPFEEVSKRALQHRAVAQEAESAAAFNQKAAAGLPILQAQRAKLVAQQQDELFKVGATPEAAPAKGKAKGKQPPALEKQIADIDSRIKQIQERVAAGATKIKAAKEANSEAQAKLYEDLRLKHSAPPGETGAKKYSAPPGPDLGAQKQKALPPGASPNQVAGTGVNQKRLPPAHELRTESGGIVSRGGQRPTLESGPEQKSLPKLQLPFTRMPGDEPYPETTTPPRAQKRKPASQQTIDVKPVEEKTTETPPRRKRHKKKTEPPKAKSVESEE